MSSTHDALSRDVCFETVSAPFESGDRRFVTVHQCIETSMRGSLPPDLDLAYADLGVVARIRRLIWAAGSNESRESGLAVRATRLRPSTYMCFCARGNSCRVPRDSTRGPSPRVLTLALDGEHNATRRAVAEIV
jgi:hypothetical protein